MSILYNIQLRHQLSMNNNDTIVHTLSFSYQHTQFNLLIYE